MRVALLSAGPSLRQTFDVDEHFDVRIGINSAAAMVHCDYWSCGDGQTFERVNPLGVPAVFTMRADDARVARKRQKIEPDKAHRFIDWPAIKESCVPPQCWSNWSITAAIALAVHLKADSIDLFGHGPFGDTDCSGFKLAKRMDNWPRVQADLEEMVRWVQSLGVLFVHREVAACV